MHRYETLVIGGGMSGLPLALKAASKGRTAFVGDGLLGGTCLNRGCIPTKTMIASAERTHQVRVGCEGEATTELGGSHLLLAAGRTPNTDELGLDHLGIELDGRGYVPVDDRLRTGVADVWAMGDLRGSDMFTHTARDDADVAYRSVFKHDERASIADPVVPHAVFVDPEVAAVGLTETQARAAGHDVAVGRQVFTGVAKANAIG